MNALLNNIAFLGLTFVAFSAQAQSSYELTCRAKAKEIATQTYSGCVTEARNSQIDQIRKDYQKQLADLKAKYDKELKKVSGKTIATPATAPAGKTNPMTASKGTPPKATKGVAKSLPTRSEVKPVAPETQDEKTVVSPDSTSPGMDDSASQNDAQGDLSIKLVPATTPQDKSAAASDDQVY